MKKASRILIYLGLIGIFSCYVLRPFTTGREHNLSIMIPSYLVLATGLAIAMPALYKKYKAPAVRVMLTLFCIGLLLVFTTLVLKWLFGIYYKPLMTTGNFILTGTAILYIIYVLAAILGITAPKGVPTSAETLIFHGITEEYIDRFAGVYKNQKMTITVRKKDTTLIAQANGQAAFYLNAIGKTAFEYKNGGIEIEFDLDKNEFILKQHGGFFPFIKEQ